MRALSFLLLAGLLTATVSRADAPGSPDLQAILDAHPGKVLQLPAGDHPISRKLVLRGDGAGLAGPGRIIQSDPSQPVLEITGLKDVLVRDVTLTRAPDRTESTQPALLAIGCAHLHVDGIKVLENRAATGAISLRECAFARITRCLVRDYMRVSEDDRTGNPDWGYAFLCTDGTGIQVSASRGTLLEGNTIVEETHRPTRELMERHRLGTWTKKNPTRGRFIPESTWEAARTDNWQQGSAIVVTSPEVSDLTRILGNHVENAAQGIDLHADHVVVSGNVVANSFIGLKAMHGSRNVLILGNQFVRNDLWAIGLMPGAAAHPGQDGDPRSANQDGGSVVAHNVISDFGHGDSHWIWGTGRSPFKFDGGQQEDDPPLTDVLVQGNALHVAGEPRYRHAVTIAPGPTHPKAPRGLTFADNLLPPGTEGVCNQELPR
jgi:hypothetical protein